MDNARKICIICELFLHKCKGIVVGIVDYKTLVKAKFVFFVKYTNFTPIKIVRVLQ